MRNNMSLETLKSHLFETLEGLKNLSDPEASENEKIGIDQAKQIVDVSGKIIDIYKVQLEGISLAAKLDNIGSANSIVTSLGILDEQSIKQLE